MKENGSHFLAIDQFPCLFHKVGNHVFKQKVQFHKENITCRSKSGELVESGKWLKHSNACLRVVKVTQDWDCAGLMGISATLKNGTPCITSR